MAYGSYGFSDDIDWEDELLAPKRPITPDQFTDEISSQESPIDRLPSFTEFRRQNNDPSLRAENPATTSLREIYNAARTRQQEARQAAIDQRRQAGITATRQSEAGMQLQTDPTGAKVPKTDSMGQPLYTAGWTAEPRYDDQTKSWVRDFRDQTGKVTTKDLWQEGDIKRDNDTGDLFLNMPGGARQVVGKDENWLKIRDIGREIEQNKLAQKAKEIDLDKQELAFAPLAKDYDTKKQALDDAASAASKVNSIALKNPSYAKANQQKINEANQTWKTLNDQFDPMRRQKEALEQAKLNIREARIKANERELDLASTRDSLQASQTRPEFAAPTKPQAGEAPDVTQEREKRGIAGDQYRVPDLGQEAVDIDKKVRAIDDEIKSLSGTTLAPVDDAVSQGRIAELNQQKRDILNGFTARQAAVNRWKAQDVSLNAQATALENFAEKRRQQTPSNNMWARALFRDARYNQWLQDNEKTILGADAKAKAMRDRQNEIKKATSDGLNGDGEFPASLIKPNQDGTSDLDPYAISLRTQGRSAAFHSDARSEMLDVLDEIQRNGTISTIGGKPIKEVRRMVEQQRQIMPEDLLTADEAQAIQQGLRGPLVNHKGELFRKPEAGIAQPGEVSAEEQNRQFLQNLLFGSEPAKPEAKPTYGQDVKQGRREILDRDLKSAIPNYAQLSPADRKQAISDFMRKRDEDLAAYDEKQSGMSPERAGVVKELQGEKQVTDWQSEALRDTGERAKSAGMSLVGALTKGVTSMMNTQAVLQSQTSGPGAAATLLRSVLATLAPSLSVPLALEKIAPKDHPLHLAAESINQDMDAAAGEHRDSLVSQIAAGVGSSLTFLPAAMVGGNAGVALMGLAQGFGDGYFDAQARAEAKGIKLSENQLMLNALMSAGLNATEGIPLARGLERLEAKTGGAVKRLLNSLAQGGEEAGQEIGQQALQSLIYKLQGLDDRDWSEIAGEAAQGGGVAGLVGLLMGLGMNSADRHLKQREANKQIRSIQTLDTQYKSLSQAVLSPEALDSFNTKMAGIKPDWKPMTTETAGEMLNRIARARNDALVGLVKSSPDMLDKAAKIVLPYGDRAKLVAGINPSVLPETAALGHELQHFVVKDLEQWISLRDPQARLIKDVVAGQAVIQQVEQVARGGKINAELGHQLEQMGILTQEDTETGTKWVLTMPAVSLLDGPTRQEIKSKPKEFAVSTAANTTRTGALSQQLRQGGDEIVRQSLTNKSSASNSNITAQEEASAGTPNLAGQATPPSNIEPRSSAGSALPTDLGEGAAKGVSPELTPTVAPGLATSPGVPMILGGEKVWKIGQGREARYIHATETPGGIAQWDLVKASEQQGTAQPAGQAATPVASPETGQAAGRLTPSEVTGNSVALAPASSSSQAPTAQGVGQSGPAATSADGNVAAPIASTFRVTMQATDPKTRYTETRTLSVSAPSAEAAEQIAVQQAKANRWKGEWIPQQVSVVKSASTPYSEANAGTSSPSAVVPGGSAADNPGDGGTVARTESGTGYSAVGGEATGQSGGAWVEAGSAEMVPAGVESTGEEQPSPDARKFAGRAIEPKLVTRALKRLGIRVTADPNLDIQVTPDEKGDLVLNFTPKGNEEFDNAGMDEELWHAAGLIALKREWMAAGEPEDFITFMVKRSQQIYDDLVERMESLDGAERKAVEHALVNSVNIYFSDFHKGRGVVRNLEDIKQAVENRSLTPTGATFTPYSVVHEFARQLVQLRDADSITETTIAKFAKRILDWLGKALDSLRSLARTIDAKGSALDGTQFQAMVADMEKTMQRLHRVIADQMDKDSVESHDAFMESPIVQALIDMGGILSKSAAEKKWAGDKFAQNRSIWDDAPKLRNPKHNRIYNPESSISPDEAAKYLADQGLLPEGSNANDLWAELGKASYAASLKARQPDLSGITLDAYLAGYRNDTQALQDMLARFPQMRNELIQHFGRARRNARSLFARSRIVPDENVPVMPFSNAVVAGPGTLRARAYHGTPHKVDKFSTEKIGTGEGAQVYGFGLYFAQEPKVAEEYKNQLGRESSYDGKPYDNTDPRHIAASILHEDGGRRDLSIAQLTDRWRSAVGPQRKLLGAAIKHLKDQTEARAVITNKGNLYTVDLDVNDEDLLDWDKPLSEQSEKVKDILHNNWLAHKDDHSWQSGAQIYHQLTIAKKPRAASNQLKELGIPGIRYLDQGSRNKRALATFDADHLVYAAQDFKKNQYDYDSALAGLIQAYPRDKESTIRDVLDEVYERETRTYNYVIFDDSKIKILEENGKPVGTVASLKARRFNDTQTGDLFAQPQAKGYEKTGADLGDLYHGGKEAIQEINPDRLQSRDAGFYGQGFYVTQSKDYAKNYGGKITRLLVKPDARVLESGLNPEEASPELIRDVKQAIHDAGIDKARARGKEAAFHDEIEAITDGPINWKNAVDRFAEIKGYDVVKHSAGEIVVKKPSVVQPVSPNAESQQKTETVEYKKNSTQINIAPGMASQFVDYARSIPPSDLYTAEEGYGIEDEPHVTVLYGLDADPENVQRAIQGFGPIDLRFGKTSLFENADKPYDVLKVDIEGDGIKRLNAALQKAFPTKSDFGSYKPHLTIAYLKQGRGKKYAGDTRFAGQSVPVDQFVFSDKQRNHIPISLTSTPTIDTNGEGNAQSRYDQASEAFRKVSANYRAVTMDYRAKRVGDAEYLRARAELDEAKKAFDDAEKRFLKESKEEKKAAKRTIDTMGEGNLFAESELPFNLQGEVDDTNLRQQAVDAKNAEAERQAEQKRNQGTLFSRRLEQESMADVPLTVRDGMAGASAEQEKLFRANQGYAAKIADSFHTLDPDDAKQEAFVALVKAIRRYTPDRGQFLPFAGAVIRNHLRDLYGKSMRTLQTDSLDEQVLEDGTSRHEAIPDRNAPMASDTAERNDMASLLRGIIATLPKVEREVLTSRLEGTSQTEIAKQRGQSNGWISNVEKVALARIKSRMQSKGVTTSLRARTPVDTESSVSPGETSVSDTDQQAEALARDAEEITDRLGEDLAKQDTPEHRTRMADLYNAHLRGRFDKLNYFANGAGEILLDAQRSAADYAAARRIWQQNLERKIHDSFGHPSLWRNRENRARMKRFGDALLPYAAALNPTARDDAGDFVFEDFWQRAGEASDKQLEKLYGRAPGDEWIDPKTNERWRIGQWVVPDPKKPNEGFYQVERFIPAKAQEKLHELFWNQYPEAAWLLDDFIEPGQEDARVKSPQGIELPTFNRHSLYGVYGDTPAGLVEKLPGYTPDVARTKGVASLISQMLKLDWKSPGRDYKSGQARITGQVRPLMEGFNIRAAQAHSETLRRETAEKLLKATMRPVPQTGLPSDFVRLDRDTFNPLIKALREATKNQQAEFPEIVAESRDQLRERDLKTIEFLFGDPQLFDPAQMVHKQVLAELNRAFVRQRVDNEMLDWAMRWVRGSVAGVLLDPQTIAINKLSNYIFHTLRTMQRVGYSAAAALTGQKMEARQAIREAGYLVKGFFTNFYNEGVRDRMNKLVPPELFEQSNFVNLMMGQDADKSVGDLLREFNVGGAGLKAVGYGDMDVHAKQKVALASMMARASIAADEAGIKGAQRKHWMHEWITNAPLEARREAENAAKLYLMDYGNVPWWLDEGNKVEVAGADVTPFANFLRAMAIPFWKYPYNYLRQIKRLGADSVRSLASKSASKDAKTQAAGNLMALAMMVGAYWLMTTPWGDDQDDEIIGRDVDDHGNELDPKLRTSSRIRLSESSGAGMAAATALRMFGADTENNDMWVRMRTMPYATQAMALGAALRYLRHPSSGSAKAGLSGAWDMMEDFMSVGSGAKMGLGLLGYRDDYTRYQDLSLVLARGGFDMLTGRIIPPRMLADVASLVDPVNRRLTPSKSLDYYPGAAEGLASKIPGLTKTLPPSGKVRASSAPNSKQSSDARAELEAQGLGRGYNEYVNNQGKERAAFVDPERIYRKNAWQTMVRWMGFNVKPVAKGQYQEALAGE